MGKPLEGFQIFTIRSPSGALTAGEISEAVPDIGWAKLAVVRVDITTMTTPDADDEVDFYIQTQFSRGADWVDLENLHFAQGDNGTTAIKLVVISLPQSSAVARDETNATLADNTKNDLPLGHQFRIRTTVTGATAPTYAYNSEVLLKE